MKFIQFLVFCIWALGTPQLSVFAQGFSDTTTGTSESKTGLSDTELQELDSYTQKQVERFRRGRESSGVGNLGSRYSGSLEMHDSDYDGISDHTNSNNALEGGIEEAAIGRAGISNPDERDKLLKEATLKACQTANPKNVALCVQNSSAVIIDRGAAHGNETDPHRIHELTQKATDKAKRAGSAYALQAGQEASNFETRGLSQVEKTARPNTVRVKTVVNGKEVVREVKIGPDIDLVRSEVAWLEDQKDRNIQNGWKYYRAKRLVGVMGDGALGETVSKFYRSADPRDAQRQDAAFAQTIAEQAQLNNETLCINPSTKEATPLKTGQTCPKGQETTTAGEFLKDEKNQTARLKTIEELKKEKRNDKDFNKRVQEAQSKIANCMKEGVWCDSNFENLVGKKGVSDPAGVAASRDAREILYYNLQQAGRGPLNQFERTVTGADFNPQTDAKTQSKPYQDMQRQVREAQKAYKDFIEDERKNNPNSPFLRNGYNPNQMSARELFGRDPSRDGKSLGRSSPLQQGTRVPTSVGPSNPGSSQINRPR